MLSEDRKDETLVKRAGLTVGRITHRRQRTCFCFRMREMEIEFFT